MIMKKLTLTALIAGATMLSADGATLYKKCAGCHGANAEKSALGRSQVIAGWNKEKLVDVMIGYKKGTYGGPMKMIMKGQVMPLSDAQIKELAEYISNK
jgi:cytochrome c553